MRLFIAVHLHPSVKDALIDVQNSLYDQGVRGNYTTEENLHLTLAFIGEYPDPQPVLNTLSDISFTPFRITLDGIGSFRNLWWAGLTDSPALTSAAKRIRRALAENKIPYDRKKFTPHITLLRNASVSTAPAVNMAKVSMTVDMISLMRSDRGKSGMIYTEVGTIEALQG